jgi:hypothetical protein
VKNKPPRCPKTAEEAAAGVIVPSPSDHDLELLAEELRDWLRRGPGYYADGSEQIPPATLERWERIATAIECGDLRGKPKMGAPKDQERMDRARHAYRLGRKGLSWIKVCRQLVDEGLLPENCDGDTLRKAIGELRDCFVAEEIDEHLDEIFEKWLTGNK